MLRGPYAWLRGQGAGRFHKRYPQAVQISRPKGGARHQDRGHVQPHAVVQGVWVP